MYLTVADFLCTLKGCPVRMTRFAMIRVVSGLRKLPEATSAGATHIPFRDSSLAREINRKRTLIIGSLPQQYTGRVAENNGPVNCGNASEAVSEEALKLVYIVRAFAASARMLAVYWVHL